MNSPLLNYHEAIERASALHLSGPHGTNLTTVIWTIDSAQFRLNFSADADSPQLQALLEHEEGTCVAYLDAVKLQFDADYLVLVRSAKSCALRISRPAASGGTSPGNNNAQPSIVRIELDPDTRFDADLRLHHVTTIQNQSRASRLGCEFMHVQPQAQRALQRYIDQTQKRRRLLSLDDRAGSANC